MKVQDIYRYSDVEISGLIQRIPFFRMLKEGQGAQLDRLLSHSSIVELAPGEVLMRRGDRGSWLYFLIKGRLAVFLDDHDADPLNYITPGELFGDLALLGEYQRKATVAADRGTKPALLFATDFKLFGELEDFSTVDLLTKISLYRTMVHSIRWRLEQYRMEMTQQQDNQAAQYLSAELRKTPTYNGGKGGIEELTALFTQAKFLAASLDRCNANRVDVDVLVSTLAN